MALSRAFSLQLLLFYVLVIFKYTSQMMSIDMTMCMIVTGSCSFSTRRFSIKESLFTDTVRISVTASLTLHKQPQN